MSHKHLTTLNITKMVKKASNCALINFNQWNNIGIIMETIMRNNKEQ